MWKKGGIWAVGQGTKQSKSFWGNKTRWLTHGPKRKKRRGSGVGNRKQISGKMSCRVGSGTEVLERRSAVGIRLAARMMHGEWIDVFRSVVCK